MFDRVNISHPKRRRNGFICDMSAAPLLPVRLLLSDNVTSQFTTEQIYKIIYVYIYINYTYMCVRGFLHFPQFFR